MEGDGEAIHLRQLDQAAVARDEDALAAADELTAQRAVVFLDAFPAGGVGVG